MIIRVEVSTSRKITISSHPIAGGNCCSITLNSIENSLSTPYLHLLNNPRIVPSLSPISNPSEPSPQEHPIFPTSTQHQTPELSAKHEKVFKESTLAS